MNLKTLKKGLELNQNITDNGGKFEYYIAKVGHLKKNIAIGKYRIFTEAIGQYKEVATIGDDDEITFVNEDTKEAQWFEGLARAIKDRFEDEEEKEEVTKEDSQISDEEQELKTRDSLDEDFKKKLAKIKEEMAKAKQEAEGQSNSTKTEAEAIVETKTSDKGKTSSAKIWKTKNKAQQKALRQDDETKKFSLNRYLKDKETKKSKLGEKEAKQQSQNVELLKKYIKQGIKAGFPASKQFLLSIGYVFFSNINIFQKIFLSILLLSSSITMFIISLFFMPINTLVKANKKLTQAIKKSIKSNKEKDKATQYVKLILIRIPLTLLILSLYIPMVFCILLIILMFNAIGLSIVFTSLLITTILILSFGYLFYEGEVANLFHEEFDLQKYKDLKRKKKEEKANKNKKSIVKQDNSQNENEKTEDIKEKELPSLTQEEERQYDIIEAFISSEHELGIKTDKALQKKVDKIINTKESGSFITKEVLVSINRKLTMENKKITNHKELKEYLANKKILEFFL